MNLGQKIKARTHPVRVDSLIAHRSGSVAARVFVDRRAEQVQTLASRMLSSMSLLRVCACVKLLVYTYASANSTRCVNTVPKPVTNKHELS